jgi:thiosulfate dehydrogenase
MGSRCPLDSREMVALLSVFEMDQWVCSAKQSFSKDAKTWKYLFREERQVLSEVVSFLKYIVNAAMALKGKGNYRWTIDLHLSSTLGEKAYQPGSSMHRIINRLNGSKPICHLTKHTWDKPFLSDEEALDIALL